MNPNWSHTKIDKIAEKVCVGYVGSCSNDYCSPNEGVPMIRTTNLTEGGLDLSNVQHISNEFHRRNKKSQLRLGDLLVARHGTNGQACLYNSNDDANCLNVVIIRPDTKIVHPRWLLYAFNDSSVRNQVIQHSTGSVQNVINTKIIARLDINVPPLHEQQRIAEILGALDDKIELNLEMNKTLEEMAMTLYKHWFVDFGPFQDREFLDSELGRIPKGWEVSIIGKHIETLGGGTPSTKIQEYWENGSIQWYSPTDVTRSNTLFSLGSDKKITDLGLQKSSARLFPENSVMMTSRATIGAIAVNTGKACTNQGFITMIPNEDFPLPLIHAWTVFNTDTIISNANGSTFKEISKSNFRQLKLSVPPHDVVIAYKAKAEPLYELLRLSADEIETLTNLRDLLLPKLISGEIRVKDAEQTLTKII